MRDRNGSKANGCGRVKGEIGSFFVFSKAGYKPCLAVVRQGWLGFMGRLLTLSRVGLLAALLAGAGCGPTLPEAPSERLAEVKRRMAAAATGHQAAVWLAYVAEDYRPETREFLLGVIRDGRDQAAKEAILLLDREEWMADAELRQALAAYYMDPFPSYYRRERVRLHIIDHWHERYPEFRGLPDRPPLPAGLVRLRGSKEVAAPSSGTRGS